MGTRRQFLSATAAIAGVAIFEASRLNAAISSGQGDNPHPDPNKFQAGDFIWPRGINDFVAYALEDENDEAKSAATWIMQRDAFVKSIRDKGSNATPGESEARTLLETMTYRQFRATYFNDAPQTGGFVPYGSSLYTGHVAIITETSTDPLIVEAIWGDIKKVRTIRYADWLKSRTDELVWHGRLSNASAIDRKKVSSKALTYCDIPYNFWNFNLADTSCFYCSKLVWSCIKDTLGYAVDGKDNPDRHIWFSPKQLMRTTPITLLNNPGNYGGGKS
ncbi:hypothetical protein ACVWWJ_000870 [Luteibacter sp. HA06]